MKREINPQETKTQLPISLQYHHVQMDGGQGCQFLNFLQKEIRELRF